MSARDVFFDLQHPAWGRIPDYMKAGVVGYVLRGEPIGGFLYALFTDRLVESFKRADLQNTAAMQDWAALLYNIIPSAARGSDAKVEEWTEMGGWAGLGNHKEDPQEQTDEADEDAP